MKIKNFNLENTGGYIYVAWGEFENGKFFAISSDILMIYDEDEYKAMDNDNYDGYEWQQEHTIESYNYDTNEYKEVQMQLYEQCQDCQKTIDLFSDIEQ